MFNDDLVFCGDYHFTTAQQQLLILFDVRFELSTTCSWFLYKHNYLFSWMGELIIWYNTSYVFGYINYVYTKLLVKLLY